MTIGEGQIADAADLLVEHNADGTHKAPTTGYPVDVAATEADGTATTPARSDHRHAHGSGYLADAHHAQSHDHSAAGDGTALAPVSLTTDTINAASASGMTIETNTRINDAFFTNTNYIGQGTTTQGSYRRVTATPAAQANHFFFESVELDAASQNAARNLVAGYFAVKAGANAASGWALNPLGELVAGGAGTVNVIEVDLNSAVDNKGVGILITGAGAEDPLYAIDITRANTTEWKAGIFIEKCENAIQITGVSTLTNPGILVQGLQYNHIKLVPSDNLNAANAGIYMTNAAQSANVWVLEKGGGASFTGDVAISGADIEAAGGYKVKYSFYVTNLAASLTNQRLAIPGLGLDAVFYRLPYAGSVVAISVRSSEARTAGTATFEPELGGTGVGMTAVLNATDTFSVHTTQAKDTDTFAAGAELSCKVTTSADWAPTTADVAVDVVVEY